jgi:hypothetical protein
MRMNALADEAEGEFESLWKEQSRKQKAEGRKQK